MSKRIWPLAAVVLVLGAHAPAVDEGFYFPPPGQSLAQQDRRSPAEVGLDPEIEDDLWPVAERWALWRHGRLVALKGDFNLTEDVKSAHKTWHAVAVGAAIQQGRLGSIGSRISRWDTGLEGKDRDASWWHVLTQSAGFDYPCCGRPDYEPGVMWTYSQLNMVSLTRALARVYGKRDQFDDYAGVLEAAYFDEIGMRGWRVHYRNESNPRLDLDLEDMGRLGLLMAAGGRWAGERVIPRWFIDELGRKQTAGMLVNYQGPNDGEVNLSDADFPESPYGFLTWANTDRDFYPDATADWAWAAGAFGYYVLWNRSNGIVFAAFGLKDDQFTGDGPPTWGGVPAIIESHIVAPDPFSG
jgi:CubicO group peptidase (beta-lactamase class C family)